MTSPLDEATLARMAEQMFGVLGGGADPGAGLTPGSGVPAGTLPVGSPGVPGAPSGLAPVESPGLGGLAPSSDGVSSVRPPGLPDSATPADLAVDPYGPGSPLLTPPAATLSPGLPDEATILRLATAFFAALPGFAGGGAVPSAPGTPSTPGAVPPGTVPAEPPSETVATSGGPAEAPNLAVLARSLDTAPSGLPTTAGGHGYPDSPFDLAGVPGLGPISAPALPGIRALDALAGRSPVAAPVSPPSTPYYFLGETSTVPLAIPPSVGTGAAPDGGASDVTLPDYYFTDTRPGSLDATAHPAFDVHGVRRDFPILSERVNGRQLVWFDNAATAQKPQAVIDRLAYFYAHENSNIHRAAHELAARSTDAYEGARDKVARFIGAGSSSECIFVRGATEAINLVAAAWGRRHVRAGDEIVISHLEHHANIVPWQQLVKETGAVLKVIPVDDAGQILLGDYTDLLSDRTKLVAIAHVSNALGTVVPVKEVVALAHRVGAKVLVDGAQSVPHLRVDVQELDADFFVFSGHKIFAPTGIGVVYGKADVLEAMAPYQTGGNMILDVTLERSVFQPPPGRFEAGTGNIADAIGLGAALDYLERIGFENAARYEHDLLGYGMAALREVPGIRLIGTAPDKASVMSFVLAGYAPEEVGSALNAEGIAVRSGHHCAQPILRRFGVEATVRPSLAFYNTCEEIDRMVAVLHRLVADSGKRSRA